jgi:hypothetical protein
LSRASIRGFVALAIILLTLVAAVGGAVVTTQSMNPTDAGSPIPSAAEQQRVINTAEQFALRVDAFDGDHPDAYEKSVTALLTTKYKAEFDQQFAQIKQLGIQKGQKGKGSVDATGITTMDADSAKVLVAHDNTITSANGTGQQHSRWTIDLVKVDGRWLVDDFTPVS